MKRVLLFSALHLTTSVLLAVVAPWDLDGETSETGLLGTLAISAVGVLGQPGRWIHETYSAPEADALEWILFLGNSLVWGAGLAIVFQALAQKQAGSLRGRP